MGRNNSSNTPQPESTATLDKSSTFWDCSVLKRAPWIKQLSRLSLNIKKCTLTKPCPTSGFVRLDATIADSEVAETLKTGFRTAPTTLKSHNRDLHDRILYYISNTKGAEAYEKQTNGNFITLIELIMAEKNDADAETGTWANNEKYRLVKGVLTVRRLQ